MIEAAVEAPGVFQQVRVDVRPPPVQLAQETVHWLQGQGGHQVTGQGPRRIAPAVSYTHLRAHETIAHL
eukprot:2991818-Alexandrium_andersonii.AAC.1